MSQTNPKRPKHGWKWKAHKDELRNEAEQRRIARTKISDEQQIARLDKRPGLALRERARLGDKTAEELINEHR